MLAPYRRPSRRVWLSFAWSAALLVLVVSLIPPWAPGSEQVFGLDKLAHAVVYAGLMFCYSKAYARSLWPLLALCLAGYGGIIELLQQFAPYRSASLPDAVANLLGVSIMLGTHYRGDRPVAEDSITGGT